MEVINELIERTKTLKGIDYMDGKTLKGTLTALDVVNPYDIGNYVSLDLTSSEGLIPLEDFIELSIPGIDATPINKSRLLELIEDKDEYYVDTFTVYEGNGELNLGVQTYTNLTDNTVLSLVVFADNPTIMGGNQVLTAFSYDSEYDFRKWLRQQRLVYTSNFDGNYDVSVYVSNHSHQVNILVCENGREIAFIVTKQNLKELDGSLDNFIEKEFKKVQPKVNQ